MKPVFAAEAPIPPSRYKVSDSIDDFNSALGTQLKDLKDPGSILSKLLPYLLTIAGLILFGMLITGGFAMMTAGNDAKAADAGKQRITTAIIGFVIIFTAFWLAQILEIMLGISILK
jgi:hypothetical protein